MRYDACDFPNLPLISFPIWIHYPRAPTNLNSIFSLIINFSFDFIYGRFLSSPLLFVLFLVSFFFSSFSDRFENLRFLFENNAELNLYTSGIGEEKIALELT
jgi:hypothetical protein